MPSLLLLLSACAAPPDDALRRVDVDGVSVVYERLGDASVAAIFLHGWASDRSVWREQRPPPAGLTGIYVDLPGHGASDKPERAYSMDFLADAVWTIVEREELSRVVLVGHSNGVPVARQFLRHHPERVAAIVSVEGSLRSLTNDPKRQRQFLDMFRGPQYVENVKNMIAPNIEPELRSHLESMMLSTPQHVMAATLEAMFEPSLWETDVIRVPLLVVVTDARMWTPEFRQWVGELAPDSDYVVRKNVGHFLMMEDGAWFNETLANFLADRNVYP